jgi:hypothetical protein
MSMALRPEGLIPNRRICAYGASPHSMALRPEGLIAVRSGAQPEPPELRLRRISYRWPVTATTPPPAALLT